MEGNYAIEAMDGRSFRMQRLKRTRAYSMPQGHYHDFYEIYYLLSGERYYFVQDRTYRVRKGDLVFINKYDLHQVTSVESFEHERILISFRDDFIRQNGQEPPSELLLPFQGRSCVLQLDASEQGYVKMLLLQMLKEQEAHPLLHETYTMTLLLQLLIFSARLIHRLNGAPEHETPLHQKMTEIMNYICANYQKPLTLDVISKKFFISPFYLSRSFKQKSGFSFLEYMNTIRIKEAQRLLRETGIKVTSIAEKVGFTSTAHFSRLFKKITHASPSEYRKSTRIR